MTPGDLHSSCLSDFWGENKDLPSLSALGHSCAPCCPQPGTSLLDGEAMGQKQNKPPPDNSGGKAGAEMLGRTGLELGRGRRGQMRGSGSGWGTGVLKHGMVPAAADEAKLHGAGHSASLRAGRMGARCMLLLL